MQRRLLIPVLIALIALLAGCPRGDTGGDSPDLRGEGGETQRDREYRFPLIDDPKTLDPIHVTDTNSAAVVNQLHATLVEFGPEGEIRPDLAEDWTVSDDGTTYTFTLREGLTFHNGEELTAEDVVYSMKRLVDPDAQSQRAVWLFPVKNAEAHAKRETEAEPAIRKVDELTVEFELAEPNATFLARLGVMNCAIVPKSAVEERGDQFENKPVGAGPFKFESWDRDSRITLSRFEDYHRGAPWLKNVVYRIIPDEAARMQAYRAGELEHSDIPAGQFSFIQDDDRLSEQIVSRPAIDMLGYAFNMKDGVFADKPKVRKAINYAVDKQHIVDNLMQGNARVMDSHMPRGTFYYNTEFDGWPYNPEKARQLLEEAGYPNGEGFPSFKIRCDTQGKHKKVAEAIQADLKRIGLDAEIRVSDWGSFIDQVYAGDFALAQNTWLADYPDPDNYFYQLLHSENAGANGNISRYSNPDYDELVMQAQKTVGEEQRLSLYREAEQILAEDAPWLILFQRKVTLLVQPWVNDLEISNMERAPQLSSTSLEDVNYEQPADTSPADTETGDTSAPEAAGNSNGTSGATDSGGGESDGAGSDESAGNDTPSTGDGGSGESGGSSADGGGTSEDAG